MKQRDTHCISQIRRQDGQMQPADEFVLEAAVNGQAEAIVTFNRRDFGDAPGLFGIKVMSPGQVYRRIHT